MKDGVNATGHHKDMNPADITRSERSVKECIQAFNSLTNPFTIEDKSGLYNLSSGVKVSQDVESDLLNAEEIGQKEKSVFIETRLKENSNFFEPVKKLKLKTMANTSKSVKIKTTGNKVIELKQQGNIAFQLLMKLQGLDLSIDLQEVMSFQLTPIPSCLGTPDGFLNKTNKAMGMKLITKDMEDNTPPASEKTLLVIDGNAIYHSMTEIPDTIKGACEKVYQTIPKTSDVSFSIDMYKEQSIKCLERERRGSGDKLLVKGPAIKRPGDWKGFLSNDENKQQFTDILLQVWSDDSFASNLGNRKVCVIH